MPTCKLDTVAVAVALALVWGSGVLFLGLAAWLLGWGVPVVSAIGSVYLGYGPSLGGSIIGTLWALVDAAIAGALYAWIYNVIAVRRYRARQT